MAFNHMNIDNYSYINKKSYKINYLIALLNQAGDGNRTHVVSLEG